MKEEKVKFIEKTIVVNAPIDVVYQRWAKFEEFPQFMEGIAEVTRLDARNMRWVATVAGKTKEWTAKVTEQVPPERIAWSSTSGARNSGTVSFLALGADKTSITLRMEYEPEGAIEKVGDAVGLVSKRVKGDLERFKKSVEKEAA